MITRLINARKPALVRATAILGGSLTFLLLKTLLVSAVNTYIGCPAWCNYLFATVVFTLLGWVYHSRVSFRLPLSWLTLRRFITQAIGLTIFDNVLYSVLVYGLGIGITVAVLATSGIVFLMRVRLFVRYVFAPRRISTIGIDSVEQPIDSAVN